MPLFDALTSRTTRRRFAVLSPFAAFVAVSALVGAASLPARAQGISTIPTPAQSAAESPGYTRALKGADGQITAVQTAIRRFVPSKSSAPTVYLVAVTHIGEKSYYTQIQRLLDKQDLVLFEGVRPSKDESTKTLAEQKADSEKAHTTQKRLSNALGVQFQLDGINYHHTTFHDSDLSWDDLVTAAKQSGGSSPAELSALKATLSGGGPEAGVTGVMLSKLLDAVEKQPAMAQMFRNILMTALSDPDAFTKMRAQAAAAAPLAGTPAATGANATPSSDLMETVLIEARNKAVLHDLKADSAHLRPGASVALFYGAGHMTDMEHRLETELGYHPTEVQWLTALNAKPASASANPPATKPSTP